MAQGRCHGHVASAAWKDPMFRRASGRFNALLLAMLKFLLTSEQGTLQDHFAWGPANYVAGATMHVPRSSGLEAGRGGPGDPDLLGLFRRQRDQPGRVQSARPGCWGQDRPRAREVAVWFLVSIMADSEMEAPIQTKAKSVGIWDPWDPVLT